MCNLFKTRRESIVGLAVVVVFGALFSEAVVADKGEVASENSVEKRNQARFREAYALIHIHPDHGGAPKRPESSADYLEALALLQENIAETPESPKVDYYYAWAMVCAAELGKHELALRYYKILTTDFYGWVVSRGAARRSWDDACLRVRGTLTKAGTTEAGKIVQRMLALDREAARAFREEALELVRRVSDGDRLAAEKLSSLRYQSFLVELIANGELVMSIPMTTQRKQYQPDGGKEE